MFKCPHCEAEIDEIKYQCYTSGTEWGRASINEDGEFQDYECDDSQTDETSEYEEKCPLCDHSVCSEDFENQAANNEPGEITKPKNEDGKEIKEKDEEEKKELMKLISNRTYSSFDNPDDKFIICNKCKQINCVEQDELKNEQAECINCGQLLAKNKYMMIKTAYSN